MLQNGKMGKQKGPSTDSEEMKGMLRQKHHFILRKGLLYKKMQFRSCDQPSLQFMISQDYRQQAMKACHDGVGNLSLERSLDFLKDRFYWAGMTTDMGTIYKLVKDVYSLKVNHRKQNCIPLQLLIH